jgi:hypothetical protein
MNRAARLSLVFLLLGTSFSATAQTVWKRLLTEGQVLPGANALPGFQANETVRNNGFRELRVTPNGNFVGAVTTDPAAAFGSEDWYLYGSVDRGTTVGALRREGLFAGQTQTSYGSPVGVDNAGSILYRASLASSGSPTSLWRDDTLLFTNSDAISSGPLAGSYYSGFSWTTLTPGGVARWVSDYTATPGGAVVGGALFSDSSAQNVLLKTGDVVGPGLTIDANFLASNLAWSQSGANYITSVSVSPSEEVIILNGQVLTTAGGGLLRENEPISAAAGGLPNETWALGSLFEVNDAGYWAMSASIRPAGEFNTTDDLIVVNGVIRYRDGQIVDGHTLSSLPADIGLNDRGDVAFVWDNTVFFNDKIIARVGDPVDTDGDGVGDALITNLFDVDLTNLPSAGGDGGPLLYLQARITGGLEVLLRNDLRTLEGDYNGDGLVDAADYTTWRDTVGSSLLLAADGDRDNMIGAGDFTEWTSSYGRSNSAAVAVPEPNSAVSILLLAISVGQGARNNRSQFLQPR